MPQSNRSSRDGATSGATQSIQGLAGSSPRRTANCERSPRSENEAAAGGTTVVRLASPSAPHAPAIESAVTRRPSAALAAAISTRPRGGCDKRCRCRHRGRPPADASSRVAATAGRVSRPHPSTTAGRSRRIRPSRRGRAEASGCGRCDNRETSIPASTRRLARLPPALTQATSTRQPASRSATAVSSICRPAPTGSCSQATIRQPGSAEGGISIPVGSRMGVAVLDKKEVQPSVVPGVVPSVVLRSLGSSVQISGRFRQTPS